MKYMNAFYLFFICCFIYDVSSQELDSFHFDCELNYGKEKSILSVQGYSSLVKEIYSSDFHKKLERAFLKAEKNKEKIISQHDSQYVYFDVSYSKEENYVKLYLHPDGQIYVYDLHIRAPEYNVIESIFVGQSEDSFYKAVGLDGKSHHHLFAIEASPQDYLFAHLQKGKVKEIKFISCGL